MAISEALAVIKLTNQCNPKYHGTNVVLFLPANFGQKKALLAYLRSIGCLNARTKNPLMKAYTLSVFLKIFMLIVCFLNHWQYYEGLLHSKDEFDAGLFAQSSLFAEMRKAYDLLFLEWFQDKRQCQFPLKYLEFPTS